MAELSEKQLTEMVVGKARKADATFYEYAKLDVSESRRQGKRVYKNTVYIKLTNPGVRDFASREVKPEDVRNYPDEWAYFQSTRQGAKVFPKVDIIPGLKLEHKQELIDIGLPTIDVLAAAEMVPQHLEYARQSAIMLTAVLEEQYNARKENENEEVESVEAEDVLAADRHEHDPHVGQREFPRSPQGQGGEVAERHGPRRRPHRGGEGLKDCWSVEFTI